jgi:hypothetical protein
LTLAQEIAEVVSASGRSPADGALISPHRREFSAGNPVITLNLRTGSQ